MVRIFTDQITIDSPDFHLLRSQKCLLGCYPMLSDIHLILRIIYSIDKLIISADQKVLLCEN